ncbi:hypothetical protein ACIGKQ_23420 [Gordonia sp. NPDC062954]|uniref:hypothetical protein n=1 Tax=Gordonia sp. NPDC062954 TaxID=3364003 RepID=UPI0037C6C6D3
MRQRVGGPLLYMIGAPAREITKWADAPHKRSSLRAGYQRELEERRIRAIEAFLDQSKDNILPSAALIAVKPQAFSAHETSSGTVRITIRVSESCDDSLRQNVLRELRLRLSDEELESVQAVADATSSSKSEQSDSVVEDSADDDLHPDSYLASLYSELLTYENLDTDRQAEMMEFVSTMSSPGLIMDGQHRIFGAKESANSIVLPVVLIPGLNISEQVFNFYVLNNKAKPLDKRQLRSIISTSLTKGEIDDLYSRFYKSGLKADEAQWTYRVSTDTGSPFKGLVSLKLDGDDAPIDDNVMDQVVSRFIKLPKTYKSLKTGIDWDGDNSYDLRLELFYGLWTAVRDSFPNAWQLASAGSGSGQLFQKVALLQLQEYILRLLKQLVVFQGTSPFVSRDDLHDATTKALQRIPEDFFLREWKRKGLDTSSGRTLWLEQLEKVVSADGKNLGNFTLFRSE